MEVNARIYIALWFARQYRSSVNFSSTMVTQIKGVNQAMSIVCQYIVFLCVVLFCFSITKLKGLAWLVSICVTNL